MTDKEKYIETLGELVRLNRIIGEQEMRNEVNYTVICNLQDVIESFDAGLDSMQGKRKENALNAIKKLHYVFIRIGKLFQDEMIHRMKNFKLQQEILEVTEINETLTKRIETLEKIDEL